MKLHHLPVARSALLVAMITYFQVWHWAASRTLHKSNWITPVKPTCPCQTLSAHSYIFRSTVPAGMPVPSAEHASHSIACEFVWESCRSMHGQSLQHRERQYSIVQRTCGTVDMRSEHDQIQSSCLRFKPIENQAYHQNLARHQIQQAPAHTPRKQMALHRCQQGCRQHLCQDQHLGPWVEDSHAPSALLSHIFLWMCMQRDLVKFPPAHSHPGSGTWAKGSKAPCAAWWTWALDLLARNLSDQFCHAHAEAGSQLLWWAFPRPQRPCSLPAPSYTERQGTRDRAMTKSKKCWHLSRKCNTDGKSMANPCAIAKKLGTMMLQITLVLSFYDGNSHSNRQ